ncbi:MAG: ABC transporter ATP-binding protein [Pyrobaculum sp.]
MYIEARGVRKVFPGVVALDGVDFDVRPGEIHGLLGENGAGKSTLISILYGVYLPDRGEIFVNGVKTVIKSPRHASSLGIALISQHFALIDTLTVGENLKLAGVNIGSVLKFGETLGVDIPLERHVSELTVGERQRVEILKALARESEVLLTDEPTSLLSPREVKSFLSILRKLAEMGKAVVFVTHKVREAVEVADRITVLRRGIKVGEFSRPFDEKKLLEAMFLGFVQRYEKRESPAGEVIYRAEGLRGDKVKDVSLELRRGEMAAVVGVAGNGQEELMELLSGFKKPQGGRIYVNGVEMAGRPYGEFLKRGVIYLPEERQRALARELSVLDNFRIRCIKGCREKLEEAKRTLDIDIPDVYTRVAALSGGNQQKLILARELLLHTPYVLVASYPTRGLDVETTERFYSLVKGVVAGAAIISIEDLEEAVEKADRIYVMSRGRVIASFSPPYEVGKIAEAMTT